MFSETQNALNQRNEQGLTCLHNHRKHALELDRLVSLDRPLKLQSMYRITLLCTSAFDHLLSLASIRFPRAAFAFQESAKGSMPQLPIFDCARITRPLFSFHQNPLHYPHISVQNPLHLPLGASSVSRFATDGRSGPSIRPRSIYALPTVLSLVISLNRCGRQFGRSDPSTRSVYALLPKHCRQSSRAAGPTRGAPQAAPSPRRSRIG